MSDLTTDVTRYRTRGWGTVPVHRPGPDAGTCSCGKAGCPKPGKHPDGRFWPDGSADPGHFADRNLGVKLGPASGDLADVDLDCGEAVLAGPHLLPPTGSAFGRGGQVTHALYTVPDRAAAFAKLQDPVLTGDRATIVELRWPEWDEAEQRLKNIQTVFPPSLHVSGGTIAWVRDEAPEPVPGAALNAAVRHVGAAVLIARYARPTERHALVLLVANLLARAGWGSDAQVVAFIAAVFAARNDADKVAKVTSGEGAGAVADSRKRLKGNKPMTGLPALRAMLDPALDAPVADKVVARVKEWLGVPDPPGAHAAAGPGPGGGPPGAAAGARYTPLPPWHPFPTGHLPGPVRDFVFTVSAAMRCDPTFVALPALAACAGMIGATRVVRLKASWHEPAMLWAAVVGDSGALKTPPYKRAVAPVVALQAAHLKAHRAAAEAHRAEVREYERLKRRSKDADPGDPPAAPACPRVYSRDTTIEALGGLLVDNRTRFLIGRDELSGWLGSFNQYKAKGGSDLANWLELHGLGTLCVDRKTGDPRTIFVPDVGVSLCGGIQPGVLRTALTPQHFSAGVPARLLFAYPPRRPKEWTEDDIDPAAEAGYHRLVTDLVALEPHTDGDGSPHPVPLGLAPDARDAWVRFYARFALKQAETEGELAAAFSKLEGYAARLALVHHVCQSVAAGAGALEPVTLASVHAGIALAEWFTAEAERVYQMLGEETGEQEARKLFEAVDGLAARHGGQLTARDLQKSNNRKYRAAADAEAALGSLVALGLGRWEDGPVPRHGGHRARYFVPGTPHDPSDARPGPDAPAEPDGGSGSHDTRSAGLTDPTGAGPGGGDANTDGSNVSDSGPATRPDRVSEVSCGVHDHRHAPAGGPGAALAPEAPRGGAAPGGPTPVTGAADAVGSVGPATGAATGPIRPAQGPVTGPGHGSGDPEPGARAWGHAPCTPHDTSDTRPDPGTPNGGPGSHGTRSPGPAGPVEGRSEGDDANAADSSVSGCHSTPAGGRVSEVSCGVRGTGPRREAGAVAGAPATECRAAGAPSVVRSDRPSPHVLVRDPAGLAGVTAALAETTGRVGLDLETTGLAHARDRVRLLSLATPAGTFLVDLFALPDPAAALAPLFAALATVEVVGQNLGFDLPFLMRLGFVPRRVRDTMLASQALHAGDRTIGHSLKELAHRHLGVELDKELQSADWSGPLTEAHLGYAARDAELPLALWDRLAPALAAAHLTGTADAEMAALPAVAWAAVHGIGFDRAAWETLAAGTEVRARDLRERLDAVAPNPGNLFGVTNWNSVPEVTAAFSGIGVALASTDDDALAAVAHPAAGLLREYRAAAKLAGTYGRDWLRHAAPDGRVYATWKQIGAGASGRMSCKEPNLQQLPRDPRFRRCFAAPPGRTLVKADYSQIELRIAARITGDKRMLDAYQKGEDLHTTTARAVLGRAEVTKADRQLAKSLNFGLLYGMGARALAAYAAANFGVALTEAEAAGHRDAFFRTYPGLRAWHRRVPDGTVETRTRGGRRRVGVSAFTEKLNTPVQGTGADGLKRALALLWERRATCPDAFPVLLVHDEIVVECAEARRDEAAAWVRDAMRDGMAPLLDPVPVEVEVTAGRTWAG